MTKEVKTGDTICVEYTGRLENGEVFDSSEGREPLEFTVGSGMVIKGFEDAVIGMKKGDSKTVEIGPEEAYGHRDENRFVDILKRDFPIEIEPEVGMQMNLESPDGYAVPATIIEIQEAVIRFDANHFLADKTLIFDIKVVETGLESD